MTRSDLLCYLGVFWMIWMTFMVLDMRSTLDGQMRVWSHLNVVGVDAEQALLDFRPRMRLMENRLSRLFHLFGIPLNAQ